MAELLKNSWVRTVLGGALGILLAAGVLAVWHDVTGDDEPPPTTSPSSSVPVTAPPTTRVDTIPTTVPTTRTTVGTTSTAAVGGTATLTPSEALTWCSGSACTLGRFQQLTEANGVRNPRGVKLNAGDAVALNLPAGVSADIWDCFSNSHVVGPVRLSQVCEASLRKT